ncbi:MAG: imidazole glycerol phosphate synthase subunit HisH [Nitrosopumilales archaeon]|nr:imidazole glycerol phosphate synthase subunit HisH [Nitrosopumilales archaeon]
MVKVAIFDYGAGNIFSLKNSLEKNNADVDVITSFDNPNNYSGLILPGVGNFDPAIKSIRERSKKQFNEFVKDKVPVLGICLGMEMFYIQIKQQSKILEGIKDGSWVYFVHSYRVKPENDTIIVADADYGIQVPAVVENDTFFGTQFHPEKSGQAGAMMIQNFLNVCKK